MSGRVRHEEGMEGEWHSSNGQAGTGQRTRFLCLHLIVSLSLIVSPSFYFCLSRIVIVCRRSGLCSASAVSSSSLLWHGFVMKRQRKGRRILSQQSKERAHSVFVSFSPLLDPLSCFSSPACCCCLSSSTSDHCLVHCQVVSFNVSCSICGTVERESCWTDKEQDEINATTK